MRKHALTAALSGTALAGLSLALLTLALVETAAAGDGDSAPALDRSLAFKGKESYGLYCRSCHGSEAKGDGSVAEYLKIPPADLTHLSTRNGGTFPYQKVWQIIDGRQGVRGHGSEMPVWGDAFQRVAEAREPHSDPNTAAQRRIEELLHFLMMIQQE